MAVLVSVLRALRHVLAPSEARRIPALPSMLQTGESVTDHPAQLFTDAELEPVKVQRLPWNGQGQSWGAKCARCGTWLTKYEESADEARRAGLEGLEAHRCAIPGELPVGF